MAARRRPVAEPRPPLAGLDPSPQQALARAGGRPASAAPRQAAAPRVAQRGAPPPPPPPVEPVGGEMQLGVGTVLVSLPAAMSFGQMLIDRSLDALPQTVGWAAVVLVYHVATQPGNARGLLDWAGAQVPLGPDMRRRLGIPDELPQVAPPPQSKGAWGWLDGLAADVRTIKAAAAARRGEVVEGVYTVEDGPAPGPARQALAHATPARSGSARAVDGAAVEALDGEDGDEGAPDIGLPVVRLEDVADLDNLWVVGPKGSGKTTLLKRLIELRQGRHWALDPHATPGKWPGCEQVGGGRDFPAIDRTLSQFITWMDKRYKAMAAGEVTEEQCKAARRTMVGDEWRAIRTALPGVKAVGARKGTPGASERLLDVLTEGRKAGICVLAASHLDTAEGMGITGEKDILKCFDLIVYLGAMAAKHVPAAAAMPRPAVVFDPEHNAWAQLVITLPRPAAPTPPPLDLDEDGPVDAALAGVVPCDHCGEPTPRAGRHCIVCGASQHSAGDKTAALAAPPKRERQAVAAEGARPGVVSARVPAADPLLAGLLAGVSSTPKRAPAEAPIDLSALSPERAARLAAIQARQQAAPSPAPSPAATEAPAAQPTPAPAPDTQLGDGAPPAQVEQSVEFNADGRKFVFNNTTNITLAKDKAKGRRRKDGALAVHNRAKRLRQIAYYQQKAREGIAFSRAYAEAPVGEKGNSNEMHAVYLAAKPK